MVLETCFNYIILYSHSSKQSEKIFPGGMRHVTYPDGTSKCIFPDGSEESVAANGTIVQIDADGKETVKFSNGQTEIHTNEYRVSQISI